MGPRLVQPAIASVAITVPEGRLDHMLLLAQQEEVFRARL